MDKRQDDDAVKAWVVARPGLVPAAAILGGALLPFVNLPFFSASLFSLPGTMSSLAALASTLSRGVGSAEGVRSAVSWLYILYLVPLAAVWLLVAEMAGGAGRRVRIVVGTLALAAPLIAFYLFALLAARARPEPGPRRLPFGEAGRTLFDLLTSMGIGWGLIIAAGLALLVVGLWPGRQRRAA